MKERLLVIQSIGFVSLAALSWFDECVGLRKLILGDNPYISDFREAALEMLFVLTVWFIVRRSTQRLMDRVRRLEKMMHVCGWCRRIKHNNSWMPIEQFLLKGMDTTTSHGICEECLDKQQKQLLDDAAHAQIPLPGFDHRAPAHVTAEPATACRHQRVFAHAAAIREPATIGQ